MKYIILTMIILSTVIGIYNDMTMFNIILLGIIGYAVTILSLLTINKIETQRAEVELFDAIKDKIRREEAEE